jgi:hypothetical protein
MRFSNPATVAASVMARAATEAEGAGVRALLPAGAAAVLIREALEAGTPALPVRPLLVVAPGPVPTNGGIDQHTGAFWLYDDLSQGTARLDALAYALLSAYDTDRGAPELSDGHILLGALSEPRIDTALGLRYRRLDYTVHH